MKVIVLFIFCLFFVTGVSCCRKHPAVKNTEGEVVSVTYLPEKLTHEELLQEHLSAKADSAETYCRQKGFSDQYCILVNFGIHSGKKRFFVWDFKKDTVLCASLCAHGMGRESTHEKPVYSNDPGSYCSSLGRYKIGVSSYSQYGIHVHYKLHGQDSTNSNAFKRIVVLHSHTPVPDGDIYPYHLPLGYSLGCPVISDAVMSKVDVLLKEEKKPVLLWIYEEALR